MENNKSAIRKKFLYCFLMAIVINGFVFNLIWIQFNKNIASNLNELAIQSVNLFDKVFIFAENANSRILDVAVDNVCENLKAVISSEVFYTPFIKGVTVYKNSRYYCDSLFSLHNKDKFSVPMQGNEKLAIFENINAGHQVISISTRRDDVVVTSYINAKYLTMIMNMVRKNDSSIYLKAYGGAVGHDALIQHEDKSMPYLKFVVSSVKYPFLVIVEAQNKKSLLSRFIKENALILIGALIISLFFGIASGLMYVMPISKREEIMRGMINDEFVPYYQPIINAQTGEIIGVEILMRWQHPIKGLVYPDAFISHAESMGCIMKMTDMMMNKTIFFLKSKKHALPEKFKVNINISSIHLHDSSVIDLCQRFFHFLPNCELGIELTESIMLNNSPDIQLKFEKLTSMGVAISLDDFGTGYSSLATLQMFPFKMIKIDRLFVSKIGVESSSELIIDNIIELANKMNMAVVAEGIENECQESYLRNKNVNYLQGYLYGKPMDGDSLFRLLSEK